MHEMLTGKKNDPTIKLGKYEKINSDGIKFADVFATIKPDPDKSLNSLFAKYIWELFESLNYKIFILNAHVKNDWHWPK